MLLGSVFTDNQVPFSVWLTEEPGTQATRVPNQIAKAQSRRLRRKLSQNFVQRAAFQMVQLIKGKSEAA
jgi:CRISPR/Cas system-associated endonuclease Cas1